MGIKDKTFPILYERNEKKDSWPGSIPWELILPYEQQAIQNHSQSLARLAERGGLSPIEMYAVLNNIELYPILKNLSFGKDGKYIEASNEAMRFIVSKEG